MKKKLTRIAAFLAFFCTFSILVQPAISLSQPVYCQKEEHQHQDSCYEWKTDLDVLESTPEELPEDSSQEPADMQTIAQEAQEAVEEAVHIVVQELESQEKDKETSIQNFTAESVDASLSSRPEETVKAEERICICPREEHIHTRQCRSNPQADVETSEQWENSLGTLYGSTSEKIVQASLSQKSYRVSRENFLVADNGKEYGWNRYGAYYGDPYTPSASAFVDFILEHAGENRLQIPEKQEELSDWIQDNKLFENYIRAGQRLQAGDLVFYRETVLDYSIVRYGFVIDPARWVLAVPDCDGQVKVLERSFGPADILGLIRFDEMESAPVSMEEGEDSFKSDPSVSEENNTEKKDPADPEDDAQTVVTILEEDSQDSEKSSAISQEPERKEPSYEEDSSSVSKDFHESQNLQDVFQKEAVQAISASSSMQESLLGQIFAGQTNLSDESPSPLESLTSQADEEESEENIQTELEKSEKQEEPEKQSFMTMLGQSVQKVLASTRAAYETEEEEPAVSQEPEEESDLEEPGQEESDPEEPGPEESDPEEPGPEDSSPEQSTFYYLYRKTNTGGWQSLMVQEENDEKVLKTCQLIAASDSNQEVLVDPDQTGQDFLWKLVDHPTLRDKKTYQSVSGNYYLDFTNILLSDKNGVQEYKIDLVLDLANACVPYVTPSIDGINLELKVDKDENHSDESRSKDRYLHINSTGAPSAKTVPLQSAASGPSLRVVARENIPTAEGNGTLSWHMYDATKRNSTKRAYLEYSLDNSQKSHSMGIVRRTEIVVYARAGETIYLGSDVSESRLNLNHEYVPPKEGESYTGCDIVVEPAYFDGSGKLVSGVPKAFDVIKDDEGYIGTWQQEMVGANGLSGNTSGYTPIVYDVEQDGFYTIHFHSFNGGMTALENGDVNNDIKGTLPHLSKAAISEDPTLIDLKNNSWSNCRSTVGAFDATVVKDGEIQSGRAFCRYITLNVKSQQLEATENDKQCGSFAGEFYVATQDGYIYRTAFDFAPGGFIFFSNNRGIVDLSTNLSAYFSLKGASQASKTAYIDLKDLAKRYTWQNPNEPDTWIDRINTVFFEEPADILQDLLIEKALAPENIESLRFVGAKEGNVTYVGSGGYFEFKSKNNTLVTITIPFSRLSSAYEDVILQLNAVEGVNRIYWDGKDGAGNTIPVGDYTSEKIKAKVRTHAGEIHFPFIDVEESRGLIIERVNKIYQKQTNENGVEDLVDVTDNYKDSRYSVYYDNQERPITSNLSNNLLINSQIADGQPANPNPIPSNEQPALAFSGGKQGDLTILDVWNYTINQSETEVPVDFRIVDLADFYNVGLEGFVFYDANRNGHYAPNQQDSPLQNVTVSLEYVYCETRWTREETGSGPVLISTTLTHPESDEQGEESLATDPPAHSYKVVLDTFTQGEDLIGDLYRMKEGEEPVLVQKNVSVKTTEAADGKPASYQVWIPIKEKTTTDAHGKYSFPGILLNKDVDPDSSQSLVIGVKKPRQDYILTTAQTAYNSSFGNLLGTDLDHSKAGISTNGQVLPLSDLLAKIQADQKEDQTSFFYRVADVGYGEAVFALPETGGSGTGWFLGLGWSLFAVGMALLLMMQKRNS